MLDTQTRLFLLRLGARIPGNTRQPCMGYANGCIYHCCKDRADRTQALRQTMTEAQATHYAALDSLAA